MYKVLKEMEGQTVGGEYKGTDVESQDSLNDLVTNGFIELVESDVQVGEEISTDENLRTEDLNVNIEETAKTEDTFGQ